jgi:hypothetical protein
VTDTVVTLPVPMTEASLLHWFVRASEPLDCAV